MERNPSILYRSNELKKTSRNQNNHQKWLLWSICCIICLLFGIVVLFVLFNSEIEVNELETATSLAINYFNFTGITCEGSKLCFVTVEEKGIKVDIPFSKWRLEGDLVELDRLKGYQSCVDELLKEISFEFLISSSFERNTCPLPRQSIAVEERVLLLVESKAEYRLYDPIDKQNIFNDQIMNVYRESIANKNRAIFQFNISELFLTNTFQISEFNKNTTILDINFKPTNSLTQLYSILDFKVYQHITSIPSMSPTTLPTNSPTVMPTRSPTLKETISFDDRFKGSKPNIMVIMLDDAGYGDVGFGGLEGFEKPRDKVVEATQYLTNLAQTESIRLTRHYGHWQCSPSRRSFLTGRLTIHTGERLSRKADHDLDLRFQWVSEKLKEANYSNYMVGKGHFGYKSVYHLPTLRGFDEFVGLLTGQSPYTHFEYWRDSLGNQTEDSQYSTHFYGDEVRSYLNRHIHEDSDPFFIFWSLQTPHTPIRPPSLTYKKYRDFTEKKRYPYEFMMYTADIEIGETVELMKATGIWNNTLLVFLSDNGATQQRLWTQSPYNNWKTRGSNYPFRGEKKTSFEGGFRVPAFLSGGVVPRELHGKDSGLVSHVSDWFSTFCYLAGVSPTEPSDENQVPSSIFLTELQQNHDIGTIDARNPSINNTNLWKTKYPAIDSLNLAKDLLSSEDFIETVEYHHIERNETLILSTEAMIYGKYKFIAAQSCSFFANTEECNIDDTRFGWINSDGNSFTPKQQELGCLQVNHPLKTDIHYEPCIFDLSEDIREETPVLNNSLISELYRIFNYSLLTQYTDELIGKEHGLTPSHYITTTNENERTIEEKQIAFFGTLNSPSEHLNSCHILNTQLQCDVLNHS